MTDKISEFHRINEPRIKRALDQIALVENSARSMRLPEEGAALTLRVYDYLKTEGALVEPKTVAEVERERVDAQLAATPSDFSNAKQRPAAAAVQYKQDRIKDLPTTDLIDLMIAIGIEMGERRS